MDSTAVDRASTNIVRTPSAKAILEMNSLESQASNGLAPHQHEIKILKGLGDKNIKSTTKGPPPEIRTDVLKKNRSDNRT